MFECKAKPIQTNLGTFRHNQTYSGIFQVYLEPCVTLIYFITVVYPEPNIFRTTLYSERWHIQNLRHIQNLAAHLR